MTIRGEVRAAVDLVTYIMIAALAAVAVVAGLSLARPDPDAEAAGRPIRPPVPGEVRGLTVPEVMDAMRRRGDPNPPDVLEPEY